MQKEKLGIWFTQGFANLFHAMLDIRDEDTFKDYTLICSHPHPEFVGLASADVMIKEPTSNKGYLQFVLDVVRTHNVKLIIPSRRQAWFNRHRRQLQALGVTVLTVASTRTLNMVDNKAKLYEFLAGKNITKLPRFKVFKNLAQFNAAFDELGGKNAKLCIKPARGVYGSGFRILTNQKATMSDFLNENPTMPVTDLQSRLADDGTHSMLLMEFLDGPERSVDCIARNGELIAGVVRCKSSSAMAAQVIEHRPDLMEQVAKLAKTLKLNGLFNVQFRDHEGVSYLLEINTRLSGRSYYASVAGVNLPYMAAEIFARKVDPADLPVVPEYGLRISNVNCPVLTPRSTHGASLDISLSLSFSIESA